ncbi:MAG: HU family DNA-binding protein [Myxococcota bacterium]
MMNPNELIDRVADFAGISKAEAGRSVDAVFDAITDTLKKGDDVRLVGFGTFATKLLSGDESRAREALNELEQEVEDERQRDLDALAQRLARDSDPRDERLLQDLRKLAEEFKRDDFWPDDLSSASTFDLMSGVETLFAGCVDSLERQVRLVEIAGNMSTQEARAPLVAERERILDDVGQCITQLGKMYSSIQGLRGRGRENAELARVRGELDLSLEVAARVQERMRAWDQDQTAVSQ